MKKQYLQVVIFRTGIYISTAYHLLTNNVTGFIFEASVKQTRLYFKNANPFSFIRLYLSDIEYFDLMQSKIEIIKDCEGSKFTYSIIEL